MAAKAGSDWTWTKFFFSFQSHSPRQIPLSVQLQTREREVTGQEKFVLRVRRRCPAPSEEVSRVTGVQESRVPSLSHAPSPLLLLCIHAHARWRGYRPTAAALSPCVHARRAITFSAAAACNACAKSLTGMRQNQIK